MRTTPRKARQRGARDRENRREAVGEIPQRVEELSNCNSSGRDTNRKLCRTIRVSRYPGIRAASISTSIRGRLRPSSSSSRSPLHPSARHRNLPVALSIRAGSEIPPSKNRNEARPSLARKSAMFNALCVGDHCAEAVSSLYIQEYSEYSNISDWSTRIRLESLRDYIEHFLKSDGQRTKGIRSLRNFINIYIYNFINI